MIFSHLLVWRSKDQIHEALTKIVNINSNISSRVACLSSLTVRWWRRQIPSCLTAPTLFLRTFSPYTLTKQRDTIAHSSLIAISRQLKMKVLCFDPVDVVGSYVKYQTNANKILTLDKISTHQLNWKMIYAKWFLSFSPPFILRKSCLAAL